VRDENGIDEKRIEGDEAASLLQSSLSKASQGLYSLSFKWLIGED
jgi:hypothetical protein